MALAFTFQSKCTSNVILVCVTSCRVRLRDTSTVYIEPSYLYYIFITVVTCRPGCLDKGHNSTPPYGVSRHIRFIAQTSDAEIAIRLISDQARCLFHLSCALPGPGIQAPLAWGWRT